jgi:hypothetical protein
VAAAGQSDRFALTDVEDGQRADRTGPGELLLYPI